MYKMRTDKPSIHWDRDSTPIYYILRTPCVGQEAYDQAKRLIDDFNNTINHKNRMKFLRMRPDELDVEEV